MVWMYMYILLHVYITRVWYGMDVHIHTVSGCFDIDYSVTN